MQERSGEGHDGVGDILNQLDSVIGNARDGVPISNWRLLFDIHTNKATNSFCTDIHKHKKSANRDVVTLKESPPLLRYRISLKT